LYEERWEKALCEAGAVRLTPEIIDPNRRDKATSWVDFVAAVETAAPGVLAYGREVAVNGAIGRFMVSGVMDFVVLHWDGGTPRLVIAECKASRKDRTYHRIQAATYRILVRSRLAEFPIAIGGAVIGPAEATAGVVRIDADRHVAQDIVALRGMDIDFEEADVRRLLSETGPLWCIYKKPLADAEFQFDSKCDDCVFTAHCLPEAARERRLELVGSPVATTRALRAAGINSIDDLAAVDTQGRAAALFRANPDVADNLEDLRRRAIARRKTLPHGGDRVGEYVVGRRAGGR